MRLEKRAVRNLGVERAEMHLCGQFVEASEGRQAGTRDDGRLTYRASDSDREFVNGALDRKKGFLLVSSKA